ncbi:hypothetical protein ABAC460_22095 [Asticcacaulis sp. AC460]|uniref:hypothetical protein n=1 Tax=Asticcacaulis sp. AC460 TaxID=1282360 RepID=UPI0003C3EFAA|nr:hypothetical protein [Asticcacaulis sp. AC460]ESQ86744.1 hypothetical protein ABAC460_22095 [Asticcacaulis sp. AC460]
MSDPGLIGSILSKISGRTEAAVRKDELAVLAERHGTDKASGHSYTQHYQHHFADLRDRAVNLLEIGIGGEGDEQAGGNSLRMWQDYFAKGRIAGLDIVAKPNVKGERIHTYQGSQADPVIIGKMVSDLNGGRFDIIIDDGSHRSEHVIASFYMLFQHLAEGGWYVIEALQTSYWTPYGGGLTLADSHQASMPFFKSLVDGLNWQEMHRPGYQPNYFDMNIVGMHFYHNLLFIRKGANTEGSNVVKNNVFPNL